MSKGIPLYWNPQLEPGGVALVQWLMERNYTSRATAKIATHAVIHGTPTGCPYLEAEDEWLASEVFASALAEVPYDSPAWGELPSQAVPDRTDGLRPICGGAVVPYEPTAEDMAEMAAWAELEDMRRDERGVPRSMGEWD